MAIAILPTKRSKDKPPHTNVEVDRLHPLAHGMIGCFLMNEGGGNATRDIIQEHRGNWTISNFNWGHSIGGYGPAFSGTNNERVTFTHRPYYQPPLPISIVAQVFRNDDNGSNRGIFSNDEGLVYSGVAMTVLAPGTSCLINFGDGTGSGSGSRQSANTTLFGIELGRITHIVGVIRGASDMDIYINGMRDTVAYSGGGGAMAYNPGGGPHAIGRWEANGNSWVGFIYHVLLYNRVITPTEARWLYEEPYAYLKPVKSRMFNIGSGSTPTAQQQPLIFVVN